MAVQNLLQPVLISVFAVLFSDYFCSIFTGLRGHETAVSVAILIIYGIMAYMGTYLFASINSLIVVVMMIAVAIYIVVGIPHIDASRLSLAAAFGSGVKVSSIGAAVSVFASCLSGGTAVSQIADDVKDPRRDIPLALILAPVIVALIYIFMAVVTLGCMDGSTVTTLADVAKGFMGSGLVVFFVVGGPLCIVPFFLKKKYPHACNYAGIKFNYGMITVLSVFAAIVAVFLAFSAFKSLGASVYLIIFGFMAAAVIYFLLRIRYLRGKGIDLIQELKVPYADWEAREAECKAMDEAQA